jgi:hypothetical protein
MANTDFFYRECYEILNQEKPLIAFQIAELVAAGSTPQQIRNSIIRSTQNTSTALPSLVENAAYHLLVVVAFVPESLNQLPH